MSGLTPPVSARDHAQGPATAPVTLVEYGDYQCPSCGAAHPMVKAVQRHFGQRLRFVFRNFPLTQVHQYAEHAAEAAEATDATGKFWEMHDMLFEHQTALTDHDLARYAKQVGVVPDVIAAALAAGTYQSRVREDFLSGVRSGVNGTPTFFINGKTHRGGYDERDLTAAISDQLSAIS